MFKLSQPTLWLVKTTKRIHQFAKFSSAPISEVKNIRSAAFESQEDDVKPLRNNYRSNNSMVANAFASLNSELNADIKTPFTDNRVQRASTVEELLSISVGTGISRKHALNVISILSEWTSSGKVKLADFENDPRFLKLCRILTKGTKKAPLSRSEDLTTVLSVTADDEAAKLVSTITLPQMVKVMSNLSQKKRRSTFLLRALAYNITSSNEELDIKQCADLLYSMSTLNFIDENLLSKISCDVTTELKKEVKKSSVIGSILTSFGLMKYKNAETLDALSDWVLENNKLCRPQDIFSLYQTMGVLNYKPNNADKLSTILLPQINESEAGKPMVWLNMVWSLVLLNQATEKQVASVLDETFINSLEGNTAFNIATKMKLLNINAAANYLLAGYQGPKLSEDSSIHQLTLCRTKEKEEMVDSVIDALKHLIKKEQYLKTRTNSGFGFIIDATCALDKKCNPQQISAIATDQKEGMTKVVVMALDYHDMCIGTKAELTGMSDFAMRLLQSQGYRVLTIPYTEFSIRDKIVYRVQYLESKLKEIVK